ncbi:hypothetical protein [Finegoldia magna]|nr:hypothetical protein [Finegoldia magna]UEB32846.1 hypothetical protein LK404_05785 [Finegoldia magna]
MEENKEIIDETKQSLDESTEKETKKDEDVKKRAVRKEIHGRRCESNY